MVPPLLLLLLFTFQNKHSLAQKALADFSASALFF